MLNETYRGMLAHKSVIRETFMYGKQRAAQIGYENVFDYSLGNPSVPCPERFTAAMQELLAQEDPVALHGYCPSQGDPEFRTAVAAHLNRTFGLPYAQKDIFPTTGAAGAIAHALRAGCEGEEVRVDMMAQISRFTGHNCPPSIIQRAVSRCLDVTSDLSVYETNMDLLYNKLKALGFEVERPGGTFYLFPKALEEDANAFCRRAREFDLLLVPSDTFGVTGYVRLAYCIDTEKVKRSLPALEKLAAAYQ